MRSQQGMSLIEMLSTLFITAFIGAIMTEIAVTQNIVSLKTSNRMDSLIAARRFFTGFQRDVHMARLFASATPTSFSIYTPEFSTSGTQVGLPLQSNSKWLTDLVSYSVAADTDPSRTGEFVLQKQALIPSTGTSVTTTRLASGVVGPMDPASTTTPKLFRYYLKSSPGDPPELVDAPSTGFTNFELSQIVGVRVTVEVAPNTSVRTDTSSRSIAFASDVFARTNMVAP